MIRETHFLFLLFLCHIWTATFHQMFTMHVSFTSTTSDMDTFATVSNCPLKRMQKQGSKRSSIISMLNKVFGKCLAVFNNFADTTVNFIKYFLLPGIGTIHIYVSLLHRLFLLFVFCLFVCLLA